jgi:cytochrome c biogenesis protein CcdA/thiol-disulfide isomerase/thioredoxin
MTLLIIAFVAGLLTVLAPCTLPLLPVIIGGSVNGESSPRRALVIAASLGASVFLFTLLLKATTLLISVPQEFWNIVSGGLLIIFGLVTLFPSLWDRLGIVQQVNLSGNRLLAQGYTRQGFVGDVLMGAALGPVFSSCSPTYFIVLATVLPVDPLRGVVYLLAYSVGLIISLLLVSVIGQRIVQALGIASNPTGTFKRVVGALFVVIGIVIASGFSTMFETEILSHAGIFDVTQIEQKLLGAQNSNTASSTPMMGFLTPEEKASHYQKAPELASPDAYLNTGGQPIKLSDYVGKNVVLVDFWTYSCINCLRTLPYVEAWYSKYKDQGLVIVGVHTPEFAFEHLTNNVADAINRLGIKYPVVQDNEYKTWNAFGNEYWPNEYLIDIDGYVVDNHAGEGDYDKTEAAIQHALAERATRLGTSTSVMNSGTVSVQPADLSGIKSPETYFGSNRNEYFGNGTPGKPGSGSYSIPQTLHPNTFYLGGTWAINPEYAEGGKGSRIQYEYNSRSIYFVAAGRAGTVKIKVLRDGKEVSEVAGADVDKTTSEATIDSNRLYKLIEDPTPGIHTIDIEVESGNLEAFTFTFG